MHLKIQAFDKKKIIEPRQFGKMRLQNVIFMREAEKVPDGLKERTI